MIIEVGNCEHSIGAMEGDSFRESSSFGKVKEEDSLKESPSTT